MTRPTAADRIADLTAEVEQQRTRAEAAEAELRNAHKAFAQLAEQFTRMKEVASKALQLLGQEGIQ